MRRLWSTLGESASPNSQLEVFLGVCLVEREELEVRVRSDVLIFKILIGLKCRLFAVRIILISET